jgi:hypothetical protein
VKRSVAVLLAAMVVCGPALAGSSALSVPLVPGANAQADGSTGFDAVTLLPRSSAPTGAGVACLWYDSVTKSVKGRTALGSLSPTWTVAPTTADSVTLSNPTATTAFSQTLSLPAGSLVAGRVVRITAFGKYTTGATLLPTLELGYNLNASPLAGSGLVSGAVSLTNKAWRSTATLITRTAGAGGTLFGLVQGDLGGLLAAAVPVTQIGRSGSISVDTTVDNTVAPTAKFGVSDASNAITCEGLLAELLN